MGPSASARVRACTHHAALLHRSHGVAGGCRASSLGGCSACAREPAIQHTGCLLQEMVAPGLLAVLSPLAVGLVFRAVGYYSGQPLLGAKAVASFLMFSMVSGQHPAKALSVAIIPG